MGTQVCMQFEKGTINVFNLAYQAIHQNTDQRVYLQTQIALDRVQA